MSDFCNPMECSLPRLLSAHGISQARILQDWVAISSSKESSQPSNQTRVSCNGRQILYHWTTREDPIFIKFKTFLNISSDFHVLLCGCLECIFIGCFKVIFVVLVMFIWKIVGKIWSPRSGYRVTACWPFQQPRAHFCGLYLFKYFVKWKEYFCDMSVL